MSQPRTLKRARLSRPRGAGGACPSSIRDTENDDVLDWGVARSPIDTQT
jgi:hypothetical protein